MDPRNGIFAVPLGQLQRADDDVSTGTRLVVSSPAAGDMGGLEARGIRIRRDQVHRFLCADLRTPVFAGLVRFSRQARSVRRLIREFYTRDRGSPALLLEPSKAVSRLQRRTVGHHGVRLAAQLYGVGRPAGDGTDRRDDRSLRLRGLFAIYPAGGDA